MLWGLVGHCADAAGLEGRKGLRRSLHGAGGGPGLEGLVGWLHNAGPQERAHQEHERLAVDHVLGVLGSKKPHEELAVIQSEAKRIDDNVQQLARGVERQMSVLVGSVEQLASDVIDLRKVLQHPIGIDVRQEVSGIFHCLVSWQCGNWLVVFNGLSGARLAGLDQCRLQLCLPLLKVFVHSVKRGDGGVVILVARVDGVRSNVRLERELFEIFRFLLLVLGYQLLHSLFPEGPLGLQSRVHVRSIPVFVFVLGMRRDVGREGTLRIFLGRFPQRGFPLFPPLLFPLILLQSP
mmetsp:Transcript_52182/g.87002  ORF Transcript_52182/g.87002 Transcript_52182/m.87002 type:complete len:293 (+) Transcript_52182:237-1115(+)